MKELISLWSKDKIQTTIWFLYLFLTGILWTLPSISNYFSQTNFLLQKATIGKLLLSQCLLIFALIASLITMYLRHAKIKFDDYDYMEDPGIYIHKKTKARYCGKCIEEQKLRRLSFHDQKGLICRQCGESYVAPYDFVSSWKQASLEKTS